MLSGYPLLRQPQVLTLEADSVPFYYCNKEGSYAPSIASSLPWVVDMRSCKVNTRRPCRYLGIRPVRSCKSAMYMFSTSVASMKDCQQATPDCEAVSLTAREITAQRNPHSHKPRTTAERLRHSLRCGIYEGKFLSNMYAPTQAHPQSALPAPHATK